MKKKILIIDDEITLQKALSEILSQDEFVVLSAIDGENGLKMAKEEMPSAILLDIIMPRMDGFKVLEELKKTAKTKKIPVLVLSNLEGDKEAEKMLELGAAEYLVKANNGLEDIAKKIKEIAR
ncbi:MAG: response regulator [bacterium]